jgi:pilus assembly protein CpaF
MNRDLELLISFLTPIKELLLDDSISEIMGNPDGSWWFEKHGRLYGAEDLQFGTKALRTGLEVIANKLGRKLGEGHPILNAQLPDGSRLAAVLPPVVEPFPSVTIRKFSAVRFTIPDLIKSGALSTQLATYLAEQIAAGKTLLISGGTSSGKTTFLNALTDYIPMDERIVVIEDTRELRLNRRNLLAAECQTNAHDGAVSFNDLLISALRWRPDRIILGEVRGDEARTLLDSFNTGHGGSMATIHASTAKRALRKFGQLAMRAHQQANRDDISSEIAESVQLVIQLQRYPDGRKVTEVIEVDGYDRDRKVFEYRTIFDRTHEDQDAISSSPAPVRIFPMTGDQNDAIA